MDNHSYRRGEIYYADLNPFYGSEQGGIRPVIVLQNNTGNIHCPTLIVAPITSRPGKKPLQPTHCPLLGNSGLSPSLVLLEQVKTIDKRRVRKYIGKVTPQQMSDIDCALEISLGLPFAEDTEAP